jgi:hypothetical protein
MAEWRRVLMLERRGIELMPVSGHSALDQVHEYLDEVDQERAAEAAIMKLAMVGTQLRKHRALWKLQKLSRCSFLKTMSLRSLL